MFHEIKRYGPAKKDDLSSSVKSLKLPKIKQRPRSAPTGRNSMKGGDGNQKPIAHGIDIIDSTKVRVSQRGTSKVSLISPDFIISPPFGPRNPRRHSIAMSAATGTPRGSRTARASSSRPPLSSREKKLPPLQKVDQSDIKISDLRHSHSRLRQKLALRERIDSSNGHIRNNSSQSSLKSPDSCISTPTPRDRIRNRLGLKLILENGSGESSAKIDNFRLDSPNTETPESSQGQNIAESKHENMAGTPSQGSARNRLGLRIFSDSSASRTSINESLTKQSNDFNATGEVPSRSEASSDNELAGSREIPDDIDATWKITQGEFRKGKFAIDFHGVRKLRTNVAQTPLEKTCLEVDQPKVTLNPNNMVKLGTLGSGFSASVIKAVNKETYQIMALKVINVFDKNKRQMLMKELEAFEIAEREEHIVGYHGAYFSEGATTLALEYMNQGSLESLLNTYGPMKETVIKSICKQALLGLKFLQNQRMMHRDIKPANILVNQKGKVKLADFGILGILPTSADLAKTMVGTQRYMSPERIKFDGYYYNADIWSLGLVAMEMALGQFPLNVDHTAGYFSIMTAICEGPIESLDTKIWSSVFSKFAKLCVNRDPTVRPGATLLLLHDFVRDVPADKCCPDWPFLDGPKVSEERKMKIKSETKKRYIDLKKIAVVFTNEQIQKKEYKRTLYTEALFQSVGEQLGFSLNEVRECFEAQMLEAIQQQTKDINKKIK
eukprot:CAMPEP_0184494602 /NCGR_PEP_ID=MMETSP0113_2-20130426/29103_1 /TAXON_ID=91329 /ORGANISM="Norrisiella sphaerica, Strain BC52" /LENGTH=723 /DNA_ID=CAMNT_0026880419 /DNA_START=594 /DNA_END=2765 /DNA_ORIENTATION=-